MEVETELRSRGASPEVSRLLIRAPTCALCQQQCTHHAAL
jgi:hypothetical protein